MADPGRPPISDDIYARWLDEMAPYLKLGATLNSAIDDAGLEKNKTSIYVKYRMGDWFAQKIDSLRATPGKLAAYILTKRLMAVDEKIKQGLPVGEDEMRDVRFMAEKHRTAQPYFVTRTETAEADPDKIGKVLDDLAGGSDYGQLGEQAAKAIEAETPTQPE